MIHALDGLPALSALAQAEQLWIDGTSPEDTYQGDATHGPWVVFDIAKQINIAGPFPEAKQAIAALVTILEERSKKL